MTSKRKREPTSVGGYSYLSPPNSPKRREGSSSGIILENGEFCDITSEGRIGAPRPLRFLPLLWDNVEKQNLNIAGRPLNRALIQPIIHNKLRQYDIIYEFCDIVERLVTRQTSTNSNDITLLVVAEVTEDWLAALLNIREFLVSLGYDALQVEFITPMLHKGATVSRVPFDNNLSVSWVNNLYPAILQCLRGSNWLAFGLVKRGFGEDPADHALTVAITIPADHIDGNWPEVLKSIKDVTATAGWPDIEVDVAHGAITRTTIAGTPDSGPIPDSAYDRVLRMGRSISTPEGTAGTFGGIVALFKGTNPMGIYGLTCHHVIGSEKGDEVTETPEEVLGRKVLSPALDHHKRSTAAYEEGIAAAATDAQRAALLTTARNQNNIAFANYGDCGVVKASSGEGPMVFYEGTRKRKDWALLDLTNATRRPHTNQLPTYDELPIEFRTTFRPSHTQAHVQAIKDFKSMKGDDEYPVYLMGQKTGFTKADRNDYDTAFRFPNEPKIGDKVNDKAYEGSLEMTFFTKKKGTFAERGDSGGWLMTEKGEWIGMLFARLWRADISVGIVEDTKDIITDIKGVLGCDDVRLP